MSSYCIPGTDVLKFTGAQVNFSEGSITFENLNENNENKNVKINRQNSPLSLADQAKIQAVINKFQALFSDSLGYTHVLSHITDTGDNTPVKQKYYRYDKCIAEIIESYVKKCCVRE